MLYQGKVRGLVVGSYMVLDKIGRGGMGMVFKAQHRHLDRVVAVKILPPAISANPTSVQRFLREVEAAAKLNHPNIVRSFDADRDGNLISWSWSMWRVATWSQLVKSRGPLSVSQSVSCVVQAGRGLAHAHAVGITHRDIKPSNLLIDLKGTVKVLDMGLARIESESAGNVANASDQLTKSGSIMGTVDYMSPEQAVNTRKADHRADIYSLGCTLFTLLTGKAMYPGETMMEKLLEHREASIPSLRKLRQDVPEQLEVVFRRMVAKKPDERQQSMTAVVAELESALSANDQRAAPIQMAQAVTTHQGSGFNFDETLKEAPAAIPVGPPRRRLPVRFGKKWLALVGMLAVVGVIFGVMRSRRPNRARSVASPNMTSKGTRVEAPVEPAAQMEPLWNGKDFTGWRILNGTKDDWGMENGVLFTKMQKSLGPAGCWLLTDQRYTDFELRLEFRLAPKSDSGIALRAPSSGDSAKWSMIQLIDDASNPGIPAEWTTGAIWSVAPPAKKAAQPVGQWNQLAVRVTGSQVMVELNGTRVQDANLESYQPKAATVPGILRQSGRIGLQSSQGRADFRKIMVKRLDVPSKLQRGPVTDTWLKEVAALPPGRQVEEVVRKFQELNPGFDGDETHQIEKGSVIEFGCATDHIKDISPLRAWQKLRTLTLAGTPPGKGQLVDLSILKGMPLMQVNFSHNGGLQALSPLKGMALQTADLSATGVGDLSVLKGMPITILRCAILRKPSRYFGVKGDAAGRVLVQQHPGFGPVALEGNAVAVPGYQRLQGRRPVVVARDAASTARLPADGGRTPTGRASVDPFLADGQRQAGRAVLLDEGHWPIPDNCALASVAAVSQHRQATLRSRAERRRSARK